MQVASISFPEIASRGQRNHQGKGNSPPVGTRRIRRGVGDHSIGHGCRRISLRVDIVSNRESFTT